MSTERKPNRELPETGLSDTDVAAYLRSHPDYFDRHPGMLAHLKLPHDNGANTVSLIERQVAILREKNRKLDQKLRELIGLARANDALAGKIHRFSLGLIGAGNRAEVLASIERTLHGELGSDRSMLVLFDDDDKAAGDLFESGFVRRVARDDDGLAPLRSFLHTSRPRCGQVKGAKRDFLFGSEASDIRSAALIPLGEKAARGFVAIGSRDPSRFHPGMSTDFLARLGELIERGLRVARQ